MPLTLNFVLSIVFYFIVFLLASFVVMETLCSNTFILCSNFHHDGFENNSSYAIISICNMNTMVVDPWSYAYKVGI